MSQGTTGITYNAGTFTNTSGQILTVIVSYSLQFSVNTTGTRQTFIMYNNNNNLRYARVGVSAVNDVNNNNGNAILTMQNNDYFVVRAWQNSGSTLDVTATPNSNIQIAVL